MKHIEKEAYLRNVLEKKLLLSISQIELTDNFISNIAFKNDIIGNALVKKLHCEDSLALFDFYLKGLSAQSRERFYPYPLFHVPPTTSDELSERIHKWEKEKDWTVLVLYSGSTILGLSLLKRFSTEAVTSGLAVRDEYQGKGLGYLLQILVVEQARLLNIGKFHVKIKPENIASLCLHEKCGFKRTELIPYFAYRDGEKIEIPVVKMVLEFEYLRIQPCFCEKASLKNGTLLKF